MNCVILQPSYIPWRGFFHQIQKADIFVFYDDVQFDKHGWRNRNRIKTPRGPEWLTIPVHTEGHLGEQASINQVQICWNNNWCEKHLKTLRQHYGKTPFFTKYIQIMESLLSRRDVLLVDLLVDLTIALSHQLGLQKTEFLRSSSLGITGSKTERLLSILRKLGATHYITGPSAIDYIEKDKFDAAGISIEFMQYEYPDYTQLYPPFDPHVSILDLLFMKGRDAPYYIWDSYQSK